MKTLGGWRERSLVQLLGWVLVLGASVAGMSIVVVAADSPNRLITPVFLGMMGCYVLLVAVWRLPLPYVWRAVLFVLAMDLIGILAMANFAFLPGPILVCITAAVGAGLFLGKRAMVATLLGTSICIAIVGTLATKGHLSPLGVLAGATLNDWLRASVVYACAGGCLAALVYFVVDMIERQESSLEQARRLEAIGNLAGGVAHDFNNYLQVVLSWSQLRQTASDASTYEALERIESATLQASELTRQLLAMGSRDVRNPQWLVISDQIRATTDSLQRMLPEDVRLLTNIRETPEVWCDGGQLRQILTNLVINARDALKGGGTIEVEVRVITAQQLPKPVALAQADLYVRLVVSDDGPGIPPSIRDHIFEPFYTTKGKAGTGMGLAIVYGAVRANGGGLRLDTEEGRGTSFEIYLPIKSRAESDTSDSELQKAGSPAQHPRPWKVLLAEDDLAIQKNLCEFLTKNEMEVETAADGDETLRIVSKTERFDLLIIDAVMPGTATSVIIETFLRQHPLAQVLVCSGHIGEELVRRGLAEGQFAFLAKPFALSDLLARIEILMRKR